MLLCATAEAQNRRFADVSLDAEDAIWVRYFTTGDELVNPNRLESVRELLVVSDPTAPGVVALNPATGSTEWVYQHRGRGPGEMRRPDVATALGDSVLVVDNLNRRFYLLGPKGAYLREAPLPRGLFLGDLCTLPDGDLVIHYARPIGAQVGRMASFTDQTFTVIPGLPTRSTKHPRSGSFVLASAGSLGCVAAHMSLEGIFLFDAGGVTNRGTYVEEVNQREYVPMQELRDTSQLPIPFSLSASVDHGKLYDWFGGSTPEAFHLVDVYDLPSLEYEYSIKFTGRLGINLRYLIVNNGVLYIMGLSPDDIPVVAAYRLPPPPDS